ncbi:MAG: BNR repeat-containing protein [Bacteroidales bacterium]|nr:BNR repeat-containing protein [Bacteroidales bacterium]
MYKKTVLLALISLFFVDPGTLFSQNPKMDGYKGIWFNAGQFQEYGYKFSGGVATFASRYRPIAIYSPEVKKTFFVYGGTTSADERHLLIMISYFDHRYNVVPKPVIVYDKMGVSEPHDNASLSIDSNGFLWIFISGRGRTRPGLIFKSSKPYSIDSFEKILDWEMISPQPWWMKDYGFLLMFSKNIKGRELYWSSSTDGKTWITSQKLADMGGHFQVSNVFGNRLVTIFNYHPLGNTDKRTNLYLLQTEDMGKTWKSVDNKIVKTPIVDIINEALIKNYEIEGKLVYIKDLNFDKNGNPVILVILSGDSSPGPKGGPREWMIIHWKDNKWNFNKVCESTNNYDMGSLYITDNEWRIVGSTEPGPQKYGSGGEMALWISRNEGIDWDKVRNITTKSIYNNSFARRPLNAQKDFYAFWADGDADQFSISRLYFTNEKCNRVWMLPYDMKKDLERPVRIK